MSQQSCAPPGILPVDAERAMLLARVWDPEIKASRIALVRGRLLIDLSEIALSLAELLDDPDAVSRIHHLETGRRWLLSEVLAAAGDRSRPHLLAPVDLQVVKACGVTFVGSMVERVIEERCGGDPSLAAEVRERVTSALGGDLAELRPGSPAAAEVKRVLIEQGLWSAYLEVGIGPDPEVFTKAPVLSSVGPEADIAIPEFSSWNNPEPELVLIVDSRGHIRGATLGNDVNLRDVEGRSSLLLGMAKDNTASSALGPFIRLFDESFTIESLREEDISLRVEGPDGFVMTGVNSLGRISRPFEELVDATFGEHHQYPDGFALYTGTLFAPTDDRGEAGLGFTHHYGDRVIISSPQLGTLANTVRKLSEVPRWEAGIGEFIAAHARLAAERAARSAPVTAGAQ